MPRNEDAIPGHHQVGFDEVVTDTARTAANNRNLKWGIIPRLLWLLHMNLSLHLDDRWRLAAALLTAGLALGGCNAAGRPVAAAAAPKPMLIPVPGAGFSSQVLLTTGEAVGDYRPPGVLDGMVAFPSRDAESVELFVTHELEASEGRSYRLANGTELTGSRITRFSIDRRTRRITSARLAYWEVRDRAGRVVADGSQLGGRSGKGTAGLESFCSASGWSAGEYGFVDRLVMAHEEVTRSEGHPQGGTIYALDVAGETLWALPELGRGSWENSAALSTPDGARPDGHVALLLGDDLEFGRAPLYLWIGRKIPGGNFTERNGLARGQLHVWVADNGDRTPQQWLGSGTAREGRFVPLATRTADGKPGGETDAAGYFNDPELRRRAGALGAFTFSRPEDLHTNPRKGTQVVFTSTGHGGQYPADDWGNVYLMDVTFTTDADGDLAAEGSGRLFYDSDETGDRGLRSPDNLVWASNGLIYVQEDKATKRAAFGADSGREASVWSLDPAGGSPPGRIAEIDRRAVPAGSTDSKAGELGAWESSGIVDVTPLLGGATGEILLLANVQAHGVTDGRIGGPGGLVEASQLLLLSGGRAPALR
ncbi:MAG: alkaline phosphatase PhoX [Gammaproteobacteria bacterium]